MALLSSPNATKGPPIIASLSANTPYSVEPGIVVHRGHPDRTIARDVHLYNNCEPPEEIGGLRATKGITNALFYDMVKIVIKCNRLWFLKNEHVRRLQKNKKQLQPRKYYVISRATCELSDEELLTRAFSPPSADGKFAEQAFKRDGGCVISKSKLPKELLSLGRPVGYDVAHIFPKAFRPYWLRHDFDRWITISGPDGDNLDSIQNSIVMRSEIHKLFESYCISISPDHGYKIISFVPVEEDYTIATRPDQKLLEHKKRPADELLRWHFRQSVLANMRGDGEVIYEPDIESDFVEDFLAGPKPAERMEFELFSRLGHLDAEAERDHDRDR